MAAAAFNFELLARQSAGLIRRPAFQPLLSSAMRLEARSSAYLYSRIGFDIEKPIAISRPVFGRRQIIEHHDFTVLEG